MTEHFTVIATLSKVVYFIGLFGFALCFGSIFTFIAMNALIEKQSSIQAVFWQRLLVSKISSACTVPGVWIFAASTLLSIFLQPHSIRNNLIVATVLNCLVVLNIMLFLSPLVKRVTSIAEEQMKTSTEIPAYASLKKTEDKVGAVNMVLLIASSAILCFLPFK